MWGSHVRVCKHLKDTTRSLQIFLKSNQAPSIILQMQSGPSNPAGHVAAAWSPCLGSPPRTMRRWRRCREPWGTDSCRPRPLPLLRGRRDLAQAVRHRRRTLLCFGRSIPPTRSRSPGSTTTLRRRAPGHAAGRPSVSPSWPAARQQLTLPRDLAGEIRQAMSRPCSRGRRRASTRHAPSRRRLPRDRPSRALHAAQPRPWSCQPSPAAFLPSPSGSLAIPARTVPSAAPVSHGSREGD